MDAPIARWSSRHFQGQKAALKAIDDELAPRKPSNGPIFPKLFALHGMGGVGKTELALQYAMQRAEDFKWVFWLSADTPISLDQSFVDIATRMQLVDSSRNADAVEATIQVKRWLAETGDTWLLIYDNADDTSFLHHALPRYGNGSVLITSRDPDVISMAACESCAVHPLEEDAAASLFSQVADYSGEAAEQDLVAKSMAQRLGGLPLAIVQVANAITQAMVPLHGILSFYDENLEAINASQIDLGGYERTLATVWECTLRSLSGQSRHLANIFCLLDPDAIDEKLLTEGAKVEGSELFRFMQYMNRLADAEEPLFITSLIKKDADTGFISMHRLVQEAIFGRLSTEERTMYCEAVIRMLTWAFPEHYSKDQGHQFASWDRCERCVKHALRVSTVIHTHHVSMDQDGPYGDLLLRCSWYLYERETYGPARQLVQRAISAFRDMTSKEYLNAVDLLGLIDMDLNQPRAALSAIEKVLEVRRSISPPDDPFTAYSLNALGLAYTELPDLDKAYRAHQEAMSIRERIGSDRVGNSYSNMASLLLRMGKPDEAEDMLKRSAYLTDLSDEPFLASGNPRHSGDMVLLSRIRLQQGTIDDALRLATAALKFRQERLGKRLKTCDSMYDVARILHMQGGAAEAMEMLNELVQIAQSLPQAQGQLARAHYRLAIINKERADDAAYEHHKELALQIRAALRPEDKQADPAFEEALFQELCLWLLW